MPTVGEVVEEAIHSLATMGVFTPNNRDAPRGADRSDYVPEDFMSAGSADTGAGAPPEASSSVPRASPTTRTNERDPEPGFVAVGKDKDNDDELHKKKRPGAVNVPNFPTVTQLPQWSQSVARALVAASVYADKAEVRWFKRASQRDAKFEDLAFVGGERFQAFDSLLCQALINTLPPRPQPEDQAQ